MELAAQAATTFNAEKKKIASAPQLAAMGLSSVVEKIQLSAQGSHWLLDLNAAEMNQLTNVIKMIHGRQHAPTHAYRDPMLRKPPLLRLRPIAEEGSSTVRTDMESSSSCVTLPAASSLNQRR